MVSEETPVAAMYEPDVHEGRHSVKEREEIRSVGVALEEEEEREEERGA